MLLKKMVRSFGSGGHITLPKHTIGHAAVVLIDDDIDHFKELLSNAYILNTMQKANLERFEGKFEEHKNNVLPRLAFIERTLASMIGKGTHSNDSKQEPRSSPSAEAGTLSGSSNLLSGCPQSSLQTTE